MCKIQRLILLNILQFFIIFNQMKTAHMQQQLKNFKVAHKHTNPNINNNFLTKKKDDDWQPLVINRQFQMNNKRPNVNHNSQVHSFEIPATITTTTIRLPSTTNQFSRFYQQHFYHHNNNSNARMTTAAAEENKITSIKPTAETIYTIKQQNYNNNNNTKHIEAIAIDFPKNFVLKPPLQLSQSKYDSSKILLNNSNRNAIIGKPAFYPITLHDDGQNKRRSANDIATSTAPATTIATGTAISTDGKVHTNVNNDIHFDNTDVFVPLKSIVKTGVQKFFDVIEESDLYKNVETIGFFDVPATELSKATSTSAFDGLGQIKSNYNNTTAASLSSLSSLLSTLLPEFQGRTMNAIKQLKIDKKSAKLTTKKPTTKHKSFTTQTTTLNVTSDEAKSNDLAPTAITTLSNASGRKSKKKKYKKLILPLLLAYKLKFLTLIPVLIGGLTLLVGTTGLAGFFFALFTAVMSLKSAQSSKAVVIKNFN